MEAAGQSKKQSRFVRLRGPEPAVPEPVAGPRTKLRGTAETHPASMEHVRPQRPHAVSERV